ncbi:MAG: hypothetical protein GX307_02190 [Euryarchaeota archaeon]|nr:hypothetical protein [Euryarchaeota archaeon]
MLSRRRSRVRDETTSSLVRNGVYTLSDTYDDIEARKFNGPIVYSFWSATKYTFALSLLLWWLPIFGQMIAGYVGGRRAGSPWKGTVAAIIPVGFFFIIAYLVNLEYIPTVWFGIDVTPSAMMVLFTTYVPVVQPYIEFVNMYLTSFFSSLQTATSLGFDSYIITVAFAYIGGVLSQQNRRELELLSKMSRGNNTTVVLEGNTFQSEPTRERREGGRGFGDLDAIAGKSDDDWLPHLRSTHQALYEADEDSMSLRERQALRDRVQSMVAQQREIERRVRRAAEERTPRPRTALDQRDWEFI